MKIQSIYLPIIGLFLFLTSQYAKAQFTNGENDILKPLRNIADSILAKGSELQSPEKVKSILNTPLKDNFLINYQLATSKGKTLTAGEVYKSSVAATGLVAMCNKPNPLRQVNLNTASAFVISADGICVTNYHVLLAFSSIADNKQSGVFLVRLGNGKTYQLKKVLKFSAENDIAIVQLETNGDVLPFLKLQENNVEIGDDIYVLGNPEGLYYHLTKGIVSNKYNDAIGLPGSNRNFALRNLIAITADFAVGSSGSPVLDHKSNVAGVVSSTRVIEQFNQGKPQSQMVIRNAIPVSSLIELINKK